MDFRIGICTQFLVLLFVYAAFSQSFGHRPTGFCGHYPPNSQKEEKHYHSYTNGTWRCCVRRMCPEGTHGVMCESEDAPETTRCDACSAEFFQPAEGYSDRQMFCQHKRICRHSDGQRVKHNGSTTADRQCECDLSRGFFGDPQQFFTLHCIRASCNAGEELQPDGTCSWCPPGSFKAVKGYDQCRSWTDCMSLGLMPVLSHGNATHDSVCSANTTMLPPVTGPSTTQPRSFGWEVLVVVVLAVLIVFVSLLLAALWYRRRSKLSKSPILPEKRPLGSNSSTSSDVEVDEQNKRNHKGPKDPLTITIPTVNTDNLTESAPISTVTPDSGIVTDMKLCNGGPGYGPIYTSSPVYGMDGKVVEDPPIHISYQEGENKLNQGSNPILMQQESPPRYPTSKLTPAFNDPLSYSDVTSHVDPATGSHRDTMSPVSSQQSDSSLCGVHRPSYVVIQNDGPVYLQYGNDNNLKQLTTNNHMTAPSNGDDDDEEEGDEYVFHDEPDSMAGPGPCFV